MTDIDGSTYELLGIVAVFLLVFANGFFVASEFSLVAVRRSRVAELVAQRKTNARALQRTVEHLDANLAATQLGITISSLALGWIGEPALAHLIEPLLTNLPGTWATIGAHAIALTVAFAIITTLHIVLGELAPKSLALSAAKRLRFGSCVRSHCFASSFGRRSFFSMASVTSSSGLWGCAPVLARSPCIRRRS